MIPGMNPRQMKQAMKRMGIAQQEIDATEVIIRTPEKEMIFTNPQVAKVNMMGQETFQLVGEYYERELDNVPDISEEDVQTVVEQTGVNEERAREVLIEKHGDLAETIMELKEEED